MPCPTPQERKKKREIEVCKLADRRPPDWYQVFRMTIVAWTLESR